MTDGEWLQYDAPWETDFKSLKEARERFVEKFLHDSSSPRHRAIICMKEDQNKPRGWVNRYGDKRFPSAWLIGIDICEDAYLNKGFGTEAFRLWVNYLYSNSDVHRLGFDTYSFNKRMVRVGEKLGFAHEGKEREIIYWQNEWVDRLHFGMLRREWEGRVAK
jgi:RimJ/RimL family protein N-acetyltransferase